MWINSLHFCRGWEFNTIGDNLQEKQHGRDGQAQCKGRNYLSFGKHPPFGGEILWIRIFCFDIHQLDARLTKCLWNPWCSWSRIAELLKDLMRVTKVLNAIVRVTLMCSFKDSAQLPSCTWIHCCQGYNLYHTYWDPRRCLLELCCLIPRWSSWVCFSLGRRPMGLKVETGGLQSCFFLWYYNWPGGPGHLGQWLKEWRPEGCSMTVTWRYYSWNIFLTR